MKHRLILSFALFMLLAFGMPAAFAAESTPAAEAPVVAQVDTPDGELYGETFFDGEYEEDETTMVPDPLYGFNYAMFHFNDFMYHNVFKPTATGYAWAIPAKPRRWVRNFFTNMLYPVRFVNNLLQGKFDAAYMETSMFIANTTWGFLGFGDFTSTMKRNWEPEKPTADGFGQTLGKWGAGHGIYLVWPFIGPSSIRDSVGWLGDSYLDPLTYGNLTFIEFGAIRVYKNLNNLSLQLTGNEYEVMTEGAVDKYAAVRDAYIRYRAKKVQE